MQFAAEMGVKDDAGNEDGRKQVGGQTDAESDGKPLDRPGAEEEEDAAETMVVTWVSRIVVHA